MYVHCSTSYQSEDETTPTKYKRKGTGKKREPTLKLYKGNWFEATFINLSGNRTVTSLDYLAIFLEVTNQKHLSETAQTLYSKKLESTIRLKAVLILKLGKYEGL